MVDAPTFSERQREKLKLQLAGIEHLPEPERAIERLRVAKATFDRAPYAQQQRTAAGYALVAVLEMLSSSSSVDVGLLAPLEALSRALQSLDRGVVDEMLRPSRKVGRRISYSYAAFCGRAAGISAYLIRCGWTESKADEHVAAALGKAGYRKKRETRKDKILITDGTVREWRRRAREAPQQDLVFQRYQLLANQPINDPENARAVADQWLGVLAKQISARTIEME